MPLIKKLMNILNKSFTLIELLVVIAIIGLLVIIIAIPINRARQGASIARTLQYEASLHRYLGSDIVGWWQFNEGEGSVAYDISGYSNDGTIHGATYVDGVPGKEGYALEFDGVNDYLLIPYPTRSKSITISLWVKPFTSTDRAFILSQDAMLQWRIESIAWRIYVEDNSLIYTSFKSLNIGEWNFISLVIDELDVHQYLGGERYAINQLPLPIRHSSSFNSITISRMGWWGADNSTRFTGKIDDLRFYSRALTLEEINILYAETKDKYLTKY